MTDGVARTLAGVMLLCAFALPMPRRSRALIAVYRVQSAALAAAAFWQGYIRNEAALYAVAAITLGLQVWLFPRALAAVLAADAKPGLPSLVCAAVGIAVLGLALIVIPPAGSNLSIPLAILLLGLLLIAAGRGVLAQTIGVLSAGNALLLTAISLPFLPFVPEAALVLAVFSALPLVLSWRTVGQLAE